MSYSPAGSATIPPPWATVVLSERDLALQVPINFVTHPGVSLTAACFTHNRFEDEAAVRCFSNLLAVGFKRFVIDVYWDPGRGEWSLCPVRIPPWSPPGEDGVNSTSSVTNSSSTSSSSSSAEATPSGERVVLHREAHLAQLISNELIAPRQAFSTPSDSAFGTSSATLSFATTSQNDASNSIGPVSSAQATPLTSAERILSIGPYFCTRTINLSLLADVLASYLEQTADTLQASLIYITLNIRPAAAEPSPSPSEPSDVPERTDMVNPEGLLDTVLNNTLASFLYTPSMLMMERANINITWFDVPDYAQPDMSYHEVLTGPEDIRQTLSGWPSENYVEFQQSKRLLVGFGSIDPQINEFNFTAESSTIFATETIESDTDIVVTAEGTVTEGCFVDQNVGSPSDVNSSWAISSDFTLPDSDPGALNDSLEVVTRITDCGISAVLNQPLLNTTADADISPYSVFSTNSLWSWGPGEPRNVSEENFRCALLDGAMDGRWRVADCSEAHPAACRTPGLPYRWTISEAAQSYDSGIDACPENTYFSVPRTALENSYLFSALTAQASTEPPDVWVDFNSFDVEGCWVSGRNASCPYRDNEEETRARAVIVPTIAAVIVFVVAALTLFVKCNNNRQNSKRRRRRKQNGWDYEGVPS